MPRVFAEAACAQRRGQAGPPPNGMALPILLNSLQASGNLFAVSLQLQRLLLARALTPARALHYRNYPLHEYLPMCSYIHGPETKRPFIPALAIMARSAG